MAIQDRFWRLILIFWSISAAALLVSLLSKPLLRAVVSENSAQPMMVAQAAGSSSVRMVYVQPTAAPRGTKRVVAAHSHGPRIQVASARPTGVALSKTRGASSAIAPYPPKAAIAMAEVPNRPTDPPFEAANPVIAETVETLPTIETTASQLGDRVSSAQKWLLEGTGISVHGLLDLGTNYNFNRPATGNNLYRVFDYFGTSSFEPNQAELYLIDSVANN
jgi:hypothetical protein